MDGARRGPSRFTAWYVVGFLSLLYGLSFVDRMILPLVANLVMSELEINARQMAVLLGAAFAIVYSVAALPLANMLDRGDRVRWVGIGVFFWSAMTVASAFAQSFYALLICRAGVALGEAVLTPAALSLIADLFRQGERTLPTSVFTVVGSVMSSGAFLAGGAILASAEMFDGHFSLAGWRVAMLVVGAPGLVLAMIWMLTVRDPGRQDSSESRKVMSLSDLFAYLRRFRKFYGFFYLGVALIALPHLATIAWLPTVLSRTFELSTARAGVSVGAVGITAGVMAGVFWPWLSARLARGGRKDAVFVGLILSNAIAVVFLAMSLRQDSLQPALVLLWFAMFGIKGALTISPLVLVNFGLHPVRARLVSIYLLVSYLIGYSSGPLLAVLLSEFWSGREALGNGVASLTLIMVPISMLSFWFAGRQSRRMPELQG